MTIKAQTDCDPNVCPRCDQRVKVSVNGIIAPHHDLGKEPCWAAGRTASEVRDAQERTARRLDWMHS